MNRKSKAFSIHAVPLARVKVPHNSWDFRNWTSFVISIPQGKAVRIFSWANQPDNDKHYGPGVHYIKDLNLPVQGTARIEKVKLFLFATTALKNKTTFYFLTVVFMECGLV